MKKAKVTLSELLSFLGDEVMRVYGETSGAYIDNLADVAHVNETTLDWVKPKNPDRQQIVENSKANVVLVDEGVLPVAGKVLIVVKNPKRALAKVGNAFFVERPQPGIHPTAIIDAQAEVGEDVYIGPYSVIGKAGNSGERTFHQFNDFPDGVFFRFPEEFVTAAFSAGADKEFTRNHVLYDDLKIFLGNSLSGCNVLERDISVVIVFGQIDQNPDRVSPSCRNHDKPSFLIPYYIVGK